MHERHAIATRERGRRLDALEAGVFDLLVIGGGITGAGIAREAAGRGLSVALLEADDFASGTSSRSSKLIHGGLRYLAMGDVPLVRETALERKRVRALAPHLAEPCWMLTPSRTRAGLIKFRAAIATYEKLGAVEPADLHQNWFNEELAEREPLLRRSEYSCACAYREYLTDDARLVLANLRSAAASGACVVSHAPVEAILQQSGRAAGALARCAFSGRELRVRGRVVVNAGGPWIEALLRLDEADAPPLLHLSKGVHVVLRAERLPVRQLVILGTKDRRSIFAIPRGDSVYLGTTDTSYEAGAKLWPEVTREDVAYLFEPITRYFDTEPLAFGDCIGSWAGLRPLIAEAGKQAREISRREEIWIGDSGLVTIAGGKLTGYRKMAEQALGMVAEVMGQPLAPHARSDQPLPGGDFDGDLDAQAAALTCSTGIDAGSADRLVRLYGCEARDVIALGPEPLAPDGRVLAGEIDWAVAQEGAETLEDVAYRRTRAALFAPAECRAGLAPAAERLQTLLGWSADRKASELAATRARLDADLAFAGPDPAGRTNEGSG